MNIHNNKLNRTKPVSAQKGAALIMSLVILAAITLLGVTNIESSSLEMKLVSAQKERNIRFAAAEAALRTAENRLETEATFTSATDLTDACSGSWCFDENCGGNTGADVGGLCFQGEYLQTDLTRFECEAFDTGSGNDYKTYWEDATIWSNADTHQEVSISIGASNQVTAKYIIEFLCFVADPDSGLPFNALPGNGNNGEPLFRISVFVEGDGDRSSSVLLQSTYLRKL